MSGKGRSKTLFFQKKMLCQRESPCPPLPDLYYQDSLISPQFAREHDIWAIQQSANNWPACSLHADSMGGIYVVSAPPIVLY
jgi:hypothetical protein